MTYCKYLYSSHKINQMKSLLLLVICLFSFILKSSAQVNPSSVYVSGYTRSDGTYVQGYYKTPPNSTINDNYTTKPNVNPYTGVAGTIQPTTSTSTTTPKYTTPTYTTPTYTTPTVYTGPNGGTYYINSAGNKTYVKH
jgi:hypothetical protein